MISTVKNKLVASTGGILGKCHHRQSGEIMALFYCLVLATAYVAALYVLVPSKIRQLDRDDPRHIQARTKASLIVCLLAVGTYPFLFCDAYGPATFSISALMVSLQHVHGVLLHTMLLYMGPIAAGLIRVSEVRNRAILRGDKVGAYPDEIVRQLFRPTINSLMKPESDQERWRNIRNLMVAPLTEEIVFRGCMVPALLSTGMSPWRAALTAPLFFGIAHAHHASIRLQKGEPFTPVMLMTTFQFAYTTLFGCYASAAFLRTGSVWAVTICHAYCNWMGLPDISFMKMRHPMYQHRTTLFAAFVGGAMCFKFVLSSGWLLPSPGVLTTIFQASIED